MCRLLACIYIYRNNRFSGQFFFHAVLPYSLFYINGYFSFIGKNLTLKDSLFRITKRIKALLIPTIVMCTAYSYYSGKTIEHVLFNDMKGGYWFTFVAFEIYVFYVLVEYILSSVRNNSRITPYISIMVLFSLLGFIGHIWDECAIYKLFSTYQIIKYLPFFYFGLICRQYISVFNNLLKQDLLILLCMVLMASLYVLPSRISICIQGYLGIYLIFAIFIRFEKLFKTPSQITDFTIIIGRHTMVIYFLHYFFLKGVAVLSTPFQLIMNQGGWFVNLLCSSITVILIILACLLVEKVLTTSSSLHRICFGTNN